MATAPTVTIYRNGDSHFCGKKVVVNHKQIRSYDSFLDKVTRTVRNPNAVRSIRTPNHGTLMDAKEWPSNFKNGQIYVAVGQERFKQISYSEIQRVAPSSWQPKQNLPPLVKPVKHHPTRPDPARHHYGIDNRPTIIHVYRNNDANHVGVKLFLDKRILLNLDRVLSYVTHKINLLSGAVKNLYHLDGTVVDSVDSIKSGEKYVAVGHHGKYRKLDYENNVAPSNITPRKLAPPTKPLKAIANAAGNKMKAHQHAWEKHKDKKKSELDLTIDNTIHEEHSDSNDHSDHSDNNKKDSPRTDDEDNWFDNVVDKIEDRLKTPEEVDRSEKSPIEIDRSEKSPNEVDRSEKSPDEVEDRSATRTASRDHSPRKNAVGETSEEAFDRAVASTKSNNTKSSKNPSASQETTAWRKEASNASSHRKQSSRPRSIRDEASDLKDEVVARSTDNVKALLDDEPTTTTNTADDSDGDAHPKTYDADNEADEPRVSASKSRASTGEPRASADKARLSAGEARVSADEARVSSTDAYKASGVEAESGSTVNDSKDTTTEKTIDEQDAQEVDEEVEEEDGAQEQVATESAAEDGAAVQADSSYIS